MQLLTPILFSAVILTVPLTISATPSPQATTSTEVKQPRHYPPIVLYSVSWCPHCKSARAYFGRNNIPYTDKDVEKDPTAMQELKTKYKSAGVPVIVIGNQGKVLRGFDPATFEKAVDEVNAK